MASSNYPFNQDTAFNSFTITDANTVAGFLGQAYSQSELVPLNYSKLIQKSFIDVSIKWFPVQEYVWIADADPYANFQDEQILNVQGGILELALKALYNYWKTQLLQNTNLPYATPLNIPMVVATPREPQFLQDNGTGDMHLILKFDLVHFVLPTSIYA